MKARIAATAFGQVFLSVLPEDDADRDILRELGEIEGANGPGSGLFVSLMPALEEGEPDDLGRGWRVAKWTHVPYASGGAA
jgi:hypothetical protein